MENLHIWVRAENRNNEKRVCITPEGAQKLLEKGFNVSVEKSDVRIIPTFKYRDAGCEIVAENSWPAAPLDTFILGLKELPANENPVSHRHIMFGHAFKGQKSGRNLLKRFKAGKGILYDLEYLLDVSGNRIAAFGYWAGFAGAVISLKCWAAQRKNNVCGPVFYYGNKTEMLNELKEEIQEFCDVLPSAIILGALGRVGRGVATVCRELNIPTTLWDIKETAHGGPFPEIFKHQLLFNCVLAKPGCPKFISFNQLELERKLRVIGDISCDPESDFNPIPLYRKATDWAKPAKRVVDTPPLDIVAIDNLPSLLPFESSLDFSEQLLPYLLTLNKSDAIVWRNAEKKFYEKITEE